MFEKLDDWSKRKEEGIKFFPGTASYQKSFDLPETLRQGGRRIYLDLGDVKNVAEVKLNGTNLGVVWTVPFRVDITPAVKPTGNVLEIAVTNLWWNRLVGDAGLPENERLAKTNVRLDKRLALARVRPPRAGNATGHRPGCCREGCCCANGPPQGPAVTASLTRTMTSHSLH